MKTASLPTASGARERALVLHGGGSAGNAWEIGVVAGLLEAGLDVRRADLIVGTSAGATAAAQITSAPPAELLADIIDAVPPGRPAGNSAARRPAAGTPVNHLERTNTIIAQASDAADMRRRMGAGALELDAASDDSGSAQWRSTVAARLPSQEWPGQLILITAVDARTGEPVVFDRDSGVDLVDAIAASTSSGAPYRIGDGRFIDGGYRRNENADLAVGYARVLVLSPFGGRSRHPLEWGMQLSAQVDELRAGGSLVEMILPDEASLAAFGDNMMNPASRPPAARAGYAQGKEAGPRLRGFWG
jgi:NTE family protein